MGATYDYNVFISEINFELKEGLLKKNDIIQILRDNSYLDNSSYLPIIEYYYSEEDMIEYFRYEDCEEERIQYEQDKPFLTPITVLEFLNEMKEMNTKL